jgi:CMP-N-acetylneuraminic acid synthetase
MTLRSLGIIPARSGSKGVPGKNLLCLGGVSLLGLAIRSARESQRLERVIVSTEDDTLAEEARSLGADVPFRRPAELATDTASTWDVVRHAVEWLEDHEAWSPEVVVVLQPTTPFRRGAHIDAVLERLEATGAPACLSVRHVDYPPPWMLLREADGTLRYFLGGEPPKRRQDAPEVHQPNGLVYAVRRERLAAENPVMTDGTQSVQMGMEESVNVDEPWQWTLAQALFERGQSTAGSGRGPDAR